MFIYFFSGSDNFCLIHVSLVPVLNVVGEQASFLSLEILFNLFGVVVLTMSNCLQKTKPTQHSVRDLRGLGLSPNILACRSTKVSSL